MRLKINGEWREVKAVSTVAQCLAALQVDRRFVAVALNGECVMRTYDETTRVREGDELEILSPMQGG